eukprot:11071754-Prorocentrum_lima.AAC.1
MAVWSGRHGRLTAKCHPALSDTCSAGWRGRSEWRAPRPGKTANPAAILAANSAANRRFVGKCLCYFRANSC